MDLHQLHSIKAHDVRAMSASLSLLWSVSLDQILQAAGWRSHNVFTIFYLRDLTSQSEDLLRLGPLVASQTVIQTATPSTSDQHTSRRSKSKRSHTIVKPVISSDEDYQVLTRPAKAVKDKQQNLCTHHCISLHCFSRTFFLTHVHVDAAFIKPSSYCSASAVHLASGTPCAIIQKQQLLDEKLPDTNKWPLWTMTITTGSPIRASTLFY